MYVCMRKITKFCIAIKLDVREQPGMLTRDLFAVANLLSIFII